MRHRIHYDHKLGGQLQRQEGFFAGRKLDRVEGNVLEHLLEIPRHVEPGTPEDLAEILGKRELVRIVRCDPSHAPTHRERHLNHLVERRLVSGCAHRAVVLVAVDALKGCAGIKHAAAAGAQNVPRQLENPEPRGMQERRDCTFLVEADFGREVDHIDTAQNVIRGVLHQLFDRRGSVGIGRLPQ